MKGVTSWGKILLLVLLCHKHALANDCPGLSVSECEEQQRLLSEVESKLQSESLTEVLDQLERQIMLTPQYQKLATYYSKLLHAIENNSAQLNETRNQALIETTTQNWQFQREVQVKEGYSSNFNRAPISSSFVLTIPNNPLLVQLDPRFQAQAGMGTDIQGEIKAYNSVSETLDWQLAGNGQVRQTEFDGYANYQAAALSSSWIHKNTSNSADIAVVGGNVVRYDNDVKIYLTQTQLKRLWHLNKQCDLWAGADGYWQKGEQVANLSGVYAGGSSGIRCNRIDYTYQFNLSSGEDFALENRLGGGQWRSRLMGQIVVPAENWLKGSAFKLSAAATYSQDEQSYSLLLNNNAIRQYRRYEASIEYEFLLLEPLKNLKTVSSLQWQKQDSNIDLFRSEVYEAWLGFRWKW